jgi:hypothetical protein
MTNLANLDRDTLAGFDGHGVVGSCVVGGCVVGRGGVGRVRPASG